MSQLVSADLDRISKSLTCTIFQLRITSPSYFHHHIWSVKESVKLYMYLEPRMDAHSRQALLRRYPLHLLALQV